MTVLKGELKVVIQILEEADDEVARVTDPHELATLDDIATRIIEALDEYRAQKPSFANLAVFSDDGGEHWYAVLQGPHKSKAIAKSKAGGLFPPGANLNMRWLSMGMTKDFRKEVLAHFKLDKATSAWKQDTIPYGLIREVQFMEPITSEDEE